MRRRTLLQSVATGIATLGTGQMAGRGRAASTIDHLEFDSAASLVDASGGAFTDDGKIAVYAESTATNEDADGNGDAYLYGNASIPLVAVDGGVVGVGATLVSNSANFRSGNEEFLLNVWDAKLGGSGTVLYDEGHDQYHTLSDFSNMANYAETQADYTVSATSSLASDLPGADAVWLTGPATAFSSTEKQALADFVASGGVVFIHDRADYSDYDETANLNDVAGALSLPFRFNDDQVTDDTNNAGAYYKPTTDEFDASFDFFADRPGMEIDPNATHTVDVTSVSDGDTVDVEFDSGRVENVRILGIDTPEKEQYQRYEREQEWEGIESLDYLATWGANATDFAKGELGSETIDLSFDDAEPGIFDDFDRLLGYIHYDATGDGSRDDFYNRRAVEKGYARLYSSSFTNHESFYDAEATARANSLNVWTGSDPDASSEFRNRDVAEVFLPEAASVATADGGVADSRVPLYAEAEADQTLDGGHDYGSDDLPLAALDETNGVAVVGGLLPDEDYEAEEDFAVDTGTYEHFTFLTNVVDYLSSRPGDVLIDGGHGQFGVDYGLCSEDVAYYQRHLEGFDIGLEGVNGDYADRLSNARAIVVTSPPESFTSAEKDALAAHVEDGGAVVLLGSGNVANSARSNLNDLAAALGTDLRLNADSVSDGTNNVNDDSDLPLTSNFDTSFPLFDAYPSVGSGGNVAVTSVSPAGDTRNEETVTFENTGSGDLDLTGYTVEDAAGYSYQFPDGFTLTPGDTVTLHTGSGTDTNADLYWGSGSYVWNDDGDTVYVFDDAGTQVEAYSYPQNTASGDVDVKTVHADAAGSEYDNLNDEYVVFENVGDGDVELTGYAVEDAAGTRYAFPDGFTLAAGDTVTLHTGSGTDTSTDLYWGSGSPIWNNSGDTVYVFDDGGTTVVEYSY